MALRQFVRFSTLIFILLCKECRSQQPACGVAVKNNKIIGGHNASPGSWPWQATLFINNNFSCGGSLITNQWVLTAAHCISPSDRPNTVVFLGLHNMSDLNSNQVTWTLQDVICHPNYNRFTYENNICLLKLSAPVNFTDYIQPICLASENSTFFSGTSSWVTGFNDTTGGGSLPSILQEMNLTIVGANECKCYYKDFPDITENMICTGLGAGGKSPCFGDFGGPLMSKKDSVWVQSGVANIYVASCVNPKRPGVYTHVSKYQKWIAATVTGTPPGFVTFTSTGTDSDLHFTCSTSSPPSIPDPPTIVHSEFVSGEDQIHFTHFTSFCVFVVLLHEFIGN